MADDSRVAVDYLARARALVPLIEAAAPRIEAARAFPPDVLAALHDSGMFRLLLPRSIGGAELDLPSFVRVIEILASGDASVAWCVGQGGGCAMAAAYVAPEIAREIFGAPPSRLVLGTARHRARQSAGGRRRLSPHRHLVFRQRQPALRLARRDAMRDHRARRLFAQGPADRPAGAARDAVPQGARHDGRYVGGDGSERHGQRQLHARRSLHSRSVQLHHRQRRRPARARPALSFHDAEPLRLCLRRRGGRHRARRARCFRAARQQQSALSLQHDLARECHGPRARSRWPKQGCARRGSF